MTIRKIWRKKQFINKFQAVSKEWIHTQERDVSVNTLTEAKKFPSGEERAWTSKLCRQAEQLSPLLVSICVKFISLGANWYNKRIKPHKCNAEEAPHLTAFFRCKGRWFKGFCSRSMFKSYNFFLTSHHSFVSRLVVRIEWCFFNIVHRNFINSPRLPFWQCILLYVEFRFWSRLSKLCEDTTVLTT